MITYKPITPAQVAASATEYYKPATNIAAIIKKLTFTNTTGNAIALTVYRVPSGGTADVTNMLINARVIGGYETYECFEAEGQSLASGDSLKAFAGTASAITIQGAVAEII